MVPFFILFGSQHFVAKFDYFMSSLKIIQNGSIFHSFWFSTFCCKIWLKKVNLKNHSKWFHFSFILVLSILLQNSAKKANLKNHSKWFHFSFILVLNILLQNLANKAILKNHSKWFHFSFILVLSILLQNLAKKSQLKKIIQNGSIFHSFWFSTFCCKIWLKKVNLKNHSKWFHFSFILVLSILLQNSAKKANLKNHSKWFHFSFILVLNILLQNLAKKSQLKNHSKWFHFSFILVLSILLQNLANKSKLKKSFKMVPFFILFGSQHFVAKFG